MSSGPQTPSGQVGEGWHPDPNARHEYRYHDGRGWTDHVADDGVATTDPYAAPPVAPVLGALATAAAEQQPEHRPWAPTADPRPAGSGPAAAADALPGPRLPGPAAGDHRGDEPPATWPMSSRAAAARGVGADADGWNPGSAAGSGATATGGVTWGEAVARCLRGYVDFRGRAPRSEYWWFYLTVVLGYLVLGVVGEALASLFMLAVVLPNLAVGARRLHDTGRSGWWQLIAVVPLVGAILLIIWFATPGDRRANAYGSPTSV